MSPTDRGRASLTPDDLPAAAAICRATLEPVRDDDWSVAAGDLTWSCRRTLDHLVDALSFYAAQLATRARDGRVTVRDGDPARTIDDLLMAVGAVAAVLAEVARAAPPEARAFHAAGMADAEGFVAMGCTEILIHTGDIAAGLRRDVRVPDDLARRITARLFPWAPLDVAGWDALRWAAGRLSLPNRPRLGPDWYWHCAPLAEWDGTIKTRSKPPRWI